MDLSKQNSGYGFDKKRNSKFYKQVPRKPKQKLDVVSPTYQKHDEEQETNLNDPECVDYLEVVRNLRRKSLRSSLPQINNSRIGQLDEPKITSHTDQVVADTQTNDTSAFNLNLPKCTLRSPYPSCRCGTENLPYWAIRFLGYD